MSVNGPTRMASAGKGPSAATRRSLSQVAAGEELTGQAPAEFERLARTAQPGSSTHVGLINVCRTLTLEALRVTVPPSARVHLTTALQFLTDWLHQSESTRTAPGALKAARDRRAQVFAATNAIEQLTDEAIARAHPTQGESTRHDSSLAAHAQLTVLRYCRLSAHHACAALCHTLDAVNAPERAFEVPSDVAGALAYQGAALGSARHAGFQTAASSQAQWEASRNAAGDPHAADTLSLLIFHEYLGARWHSQAEFHRRRVETFIGWALEGQPANAIVQS